MFHSRVAVETAFSCGFIYRKDVTRRDDALITSAGGLASPLSADVAADRVDSANLIPGILPEDVEIDGGSAAAEHTVTATIDEIDQPAH